jgi:uncharacterized tellurite resistance protein B-like protein
VSTERTQLSLASLEIPRLEAVVELMFLAAYADGVVSGVERDELATQVSEGVGGVLDPATIKGMLSFIEAALEQEGREARFESIRRRLGDPKMRLAALSTAVKILKADQVVAPSEVAWLVRAAAQLGVEVEDALALLRTSPQGGV